MNRQHPAEPTESTSSLFKAHPCRPNHPTITTICRGSQATASKHCSPQGLVSGQVVGPSTHGSVSVRGEVGVHTAVHRVTYTNQTGNTPWAPTTGRTEKLPFCWGGAQYIYIYVLFLHRQGSGREQTTRLKVQQSRTGRQGN